MSSKKKISRNSAYGSFVGHPKTKTVERWRTTDSGRSVTIKTSKTSARIMDEAVKFYAAALKRLGKR